VRAKCFIIYLVNCQNCILWWRKWKNEELCFNSHVMQSVHNCSLGQLISSSIGVSVATLGTGARCEVTTYFIQVPKLSKRRAMSPIPTSIRP